MRILLVDDEAVSRKYLSDFLGRRHGHEVSQVENGEQALVEMRREPYPLVLTDIIMPGMSGLELLTEIKNLPYGRDSDVILLTGYADVSTAVQALRAGAYDYLRKPVKLDELVASVNRAAEHQALLRDNRELTSYFEQRLADATRETESKLKNIRRAYAEIVGTGRIGVFSDAMRAVLAMADRLNSDRSVPVLIEGETGTGKELVARRVHYGKGEVTTPFVSINCSALTATLFESELFGYEGGAFSGAKRNGQKGKLELADGGTLFLDEIGDMPLELQPKLLRVLEERAFYRVGGLRLIEVDLRIICATNKKLEAEVERGSFRRDLYYRLNLGRISLPPLRERREAIAPLAYMFLDYYASVKNSSFRGFTPEALNLLKEHAWPGNVRELENAVERVVLMYNDSMVTPRHLQFLNQDKTDTTQQHLDLTTLCPGALALPPDSLDLGQLESEIVRRALAMFGGNKTQTAKYLNLTRSELYSRLKNI